MKQQCEAQSWSFRRRESTTSRTEFLRGSGRSIPIKDSLIAATALVHRLTVATRNRHDFEQAGVQIVDPFS